MRWRRLNWKSLDGLSNKSQRNQDNLMGCRACPPSQENGLLKFLDLQLNININNCHLAQNRSRIILKMDFN